MPKSSNLRCFFFDSDGNPIDGGCRRSSYVCSYYHPEEEGWESARRSIHRPTKKRRRLSHRDSGYQRHRRSRSRSRSRHDSIASSVPPSPRNFMTSHSPRRMSLSEKVPNNVNKVPQASTSSAIPKPSSPKQRASSSSSHPTASLPTPPVTTSLSAGFDDAPFPLPPRPSAMATSTIIPTQPRALQPSSVLRRLPRSRTDSSAPAPPPKDPFPMLPPPPPPVVPLTLSTGLAPTAIVEPTVEEKRATWDERTRILSEAGLAREQLVALEEQHVFALQIVESRYFTNLPEEDKIRLKDQLTQLEKQHDDAKKKHEESVDKLFKTGSWPAAPPSAIEDDMQEKHKEVVQCIQELKDTALQMSKILGDIYTLKPPLFLPGDSDDSDGGAAMDVDKPDTAHRRSLKWRPISENLDRSGGRSAPSMPTQAELDEFLERLAHMEGLISTLENDINQNNREAREEFEHLVDTKLDEFQAAKEAEERQRVEEEEQQLQYLEQEITLTGEQVGELATEIGDLIMRVGRLEVDVVTSRRGRQESFEKVMEVEQRLQEYISTREATANVIQTFEKALNAYTSRPPSPPATPLNMVPSFDYIFQSLEEPMVQAVRSNLVPVIENLRKDVEDIVRTQNTELYSTLWNKMTLTLKVLDMIQSKLNQGDIEPGQALAEDIAKL